MFSGRQRSQLVADLETTTDPNDCRVWGWGIHRIGSNQPVYFGHELSELIDGIKNDSSIIYFHNLGFDGKFIVDWLLNNGYKWTNENSTVPGEFKTLISKMGKWYSLTVHWDSGVKTEFRDSLKKIPLSVDGIARAYKLDTLKGDIDYHQYRPRGHVMTDEELDYLRNDVLIVSQAMDITLKEGAKKLTVGSDAMHEYQKLFGSERFKTLFPILPTDLDAEMRKAYRGGFTYADKRFQGKATGAGKAYDVNSLYPSVMYNEWLPYGEPQYQPGGPDGSKRLFITCVTFTAELKSNHIPCIQIKNSGHFINTVYQESITEPVTLYCTSVDLELWQEHYDMNIIEYGGTWYFKAAQGMFSKYIDKWMEVKENSTGGKRQIAKLYLNSLYGKFATNPDVTSKYPVLEDGVVKYRTGDPETRDPVYTPMGAFITAYARAITIRAAQQLYPRFLYADTDSLHIMGLREPDLDIHPTRLGAWKHEYDFTSGKFLRAKAYSELVKGEYVTHIAGLPTSEAAKLTFADLYDGAVLGQKLVPRSVPGGVVLVEQDYTLKI